MGRDMDGVDGVVSELFLQDATELLYESDRTRVHRLTAADGSGHVVCKEPLGPDAGRRLRNERGILERLAGVDGVPGLSPLAAPPGSLFVEAVDGPSLRTVLAEGPLDVAATLRLAADLAAVLAAVHRRGVVHKDLSPANIIVEAHSGRPHLVDFELATTFAVECPTFTHHNEIVGTLAYLAPEQTGRTGRLTDERADLYALGAVLYEALTGDPPFGTGSPFRLVHDHLARVPMPLVERDPAVPGVLSDIVARLLEKEPDLRYQSAEGLAHDLAVLRDRWGSGDGDLRLVLGERDFPLRLAPPSRLVGREGELELLGRAFEDVLAGGRRCVLVAGDPGVGKTALLQELRPGVIRAGGWFVTGKFDQYRREQEFDGVFQALRELTRRLLAEPRSQVAELGGRLRAHLGGNLGLAAATFPELARLLDVAPETVDQDPVTLRGRLHQVGLGLLRAVASPERPVVMVVDDLQWAGTTPLGLLDAIQIDGDLSGVLLLGAHRSSEVDAVHPLTALLSRWERLEASVQRVELSNLPPVALGTMLSEMLRLTPERAAPLAEAVGELTGGNPYDTVETVNALRHEGVLRLGDHGWEWDRGAIGTCLGSSDVVGLLGARMDALKTAAVELLQIMACLGGEVTAELLGVAAGLDAGGIEECLRPALEDGLLVMDHATSSVRFRHDRVHQAAFDRLGPRERVHLNLAIARRLAAEPSHEVFAAEPYLHALTVVHDPQEQRRVVDLFRAAAAHTRAVANYALMERYCAAGIEVLESAAGVEAPERRALLIRLATEHHMALCSLGRLDEADGVHRRILELTPDPIERSESTWAQVSSLTNQNRARDAVALAVDLLGQLGVPMPRDPEALAAEIDAGMETLYRWASEGDETDDLRRPEYDDPRVQAIARTINRATPPAFFSDQTAMTWMLIQAVRLWAEHGPAPALLGPLCHVSFISTALRDDYRTGYVIARRALAVAEARGYEVDLPLARFVFSLGSSSWFEPLEAAVVHARRAHEGLVQGGDLHFASNTYYTVLPDLLECAPSLDEVAEEAEAAVEFCARTSNDQAGQVFLAYRQLVRVLRGDTGGRPGDFAEPSFDEEGYVAALSVNPVAAANHHLTRSIAAALFGDAQALARHSDAAVGLMPFIQATNAMTPVHTLRAVSLAQQARAADAEARGPLLAEFAVHRDWLAARAQDAPGNVLHLLHLVEAERAWALDDLRGALRAFDAAQREVAPRHRPWQRGYILERAGIFSLEQEIEERGRTLLGEARQVYADWGATAKVATLEAYAPPTDPHDVMARLSG